MKKEDTIPPSALSARLGWSVPTLRRAVVDAQARIRVGQLNPALDLRADDARERDAALADFARTPGNHQRWSLAAAARVLRAFGKPVPEAWQKSEAA